MSEARFTELDSIYEQATGSTTTERPVLLRVFKDRGRLTCGQRFPDCDQIPLFPEEIVFPPDRPAWARSVRLPPVPMTVLWRGSVIDDFCPRTAVLGAFTSGPAEVRPTANAVVPQ